MLIPENTLAEKPDVSMHKGSPSCPNCAGEARGYGCVEANLVLPGNEAGMSEYIELQG